MNQSIKYSPTGYYDINAGNIRTVGSDSVEIDHILILGDLPNDISNTDVITADNLGRLHKLPKSSLPSTNPFDQDLNTTDSVDFVNATTTNGLFTDNIYEENPNACISLRNRVCMPNISTINSDNQILTIDTVSDNLERSPTAFINQTGQINTGQGYTFIHPMNQSLLSSSNVIFNEVGTNIIKERVLNQGTTFLNRVIMPNVTENNSTNFILTLDKVSFNVEKSLAEVSITGSIGTPGVITCASINTGQGQNEVYPMNQSVLTTDPVIFSGITLNNTANAINNTKILTLNDPLNFVEYTNLSDLDIGDVSSIGASVDNAIVKYDGISGTSIQSSSVIIDDLDNISTLGTVSCDTLPILPGFSPDLVVCKLTDDKLREIALADLYQQDLKPVSNVVFNALTVNGTLIGNNLLDDPLTQPQTVLITQSTVNNQLYRREFQPVYGSAISLAVPLVVALPVVNVFVEPALNLAMTTSKNCTDFINSIVISGTITEPFVASIDYAVSYSSGSNTTITYEFSIRVNSFVQTPAVQTTILKSADERHNVSCHFVMLLNPSDEIQLVVKNVSGTESITINNYTLTVSKIFE